MTINVTGEFGLIIRRRALHAHGISVDAVLRAMETSKPFDSHDELIAFGPSFGQEALDAFVERLLGLGLVYFDDFFEFSGTFPAWCQFRAVLTA